MKKNKEIKWILLAGGIALTVIFTVTAYFLRKQNIRQEYAQQMRAARVAIENSSYDAIVTAYETAIELRPEDPQAYLELADFYLDQGKYYEATSTIKRGMTLISDGRLESMLDIIQEKMQPPTREEDIFIGDAAAMIEVVDSDSLVLRMQFLDALSNYCYQQYLNEYGDSVVSVVSGGEGYQVKFNGLSAYVYYKNTSEYPDAIDEVRRTPASNYKPYKIVIQDPNTLFVGYDGAISAGRLCQIFDQETQPVFSKDISSTYYMEFSYMDCTLWFVTDSRGNVTGTKTEIIIWPKNLCTNWEEEEKEPEEESEEDLGTFVLDGKTYTYDIRELIIENGSLPDLTPLSQCKNLEYIYFYNCSIADLSPISGCTALTELNLNASYGGLSLECVRNLPNLCYLGFHECKDIDTIAPIMDKELKLLHVCESSVSWEETQQYIALHPSCEVWFDYYMING